MPWCTYEHLSSCQVFFFFKSVLCPEREVWKKKVVAFHHSTLKVRGERHTHTHSLQSNLICFHFLLCSSTTKNPCLISQLDVFCFKWYTQAGYSKTVSPAPLWNQCCVDIEIEVPLIWAVLWLVYHFESTHLVLCFCPGQYHTTCRKLINVYW